MREKKSKTKKDSEISHQDIIRHFDEKTEETKRHFDIVAEDLTSKIEIISKAVLEIPAIKSSVESMKEMVGKNSEDIEVIKMDIQSMKHMLRRKVDVEEFAVLEKRVATLENKL